MLPIFLIAERHSDLHAHVFAVGNRDNDSAFDIACRSPSNGTRAARDVRDHARRNAVVRRFAGRFLRRDECRGQSCEKQRPFS